jgi:hypothetical protein
MEDKIDKIYEVISDKTLSFGCKIKQWRLSTIIWKDYDEKWETNNRYRMIDDWENTFTWLVSESSIIWHPILLWDVLDWVYNKVEDKWIDVKELIWIREQKRKSIKEQSEQCINFIYNIIKLKWIQKNEK